MCRTIESQYPIFLPETNVNKLIQEILAYHTNDGSCVERLEHDGGKLVRNTSILGASDPTKSHKMTGYKITVYQNLHWDSLRSGQDLGQ
jgi:hypothetical protein